MKLLPIVIALLLSYPFSSLAAIQGQEIAYRAVDSVLKGYLAYDAASAGPRPGILVVHEWWGLNDYARERARMLAELGYTALAVDMYGQGKQAAHPEEAKKFAGEVRANLPLAKQRLLAGVQVLKAHPTVNDDRIAAIGYCFGGGILLELARRGLDLDGIASFHGTLQTERPAQPGEIATAILVLNGAADPFVSPEDIGQFSQEMAKAGVYYHFVNYPGAKHSFTNPQADRFGKQYELPLAYSPEADRRSWQEMQDFLRDIFK
ncbi:MAG: dienelactone hydrolase family protein [Desulfuromonadales bacterium]